MADLTQKIQLVVDGFRKLKNLKTEVQKTSDLVKELASDFRQVDRGIRESQKTLNRVGRDRYKRDAKGRFVNDPDRNTRRDALSSEVNLIKQRGTLLKVNSALAAKTTALTVAKRKELELDKARQKSVQTELRLQANKTFISRKLIEGRAAGLRPTGFGLSEKPDSARGKRRTELNQALDALEKGFNDLNVEGNENVATFRAFGSQISRTVEELNALNRTVAKGSIGFEKARRLQERLDVVDPAKGAKTFKNKAASALSPTAAQIQTARDSSANLLKAARSGDQNLYNAALAKATAQVSRLERAYKEAETVQKKASDHDKKAQRRLRNIRKIRQDRNDRTRESLMLGAGFPLLFGGGVGAVAGGVGGALAQRGGKGFGAQIFFSAIGQQFDALISSMVSSTQKLGNALGQYTQDTGQLVQSLGLAGTAEGQRIKIIEELQGANAAFTAAMQQLTNAVGQKGVADLKKFGDNVRLVGSEMRIFFTKVQAGLAGILNLADKILRLSQGAKESRIERFVETTDNAEIVALRKRRDEILEGTGGGRSGAKRRGESVAKIEEQMAGLGAPALAQQDAAVAVDTIMMRQKEMTKSLEEEFAIHSKILDLKKEHGLTDEVAKAVAQEALIIDRSSEALNKKLNELKAKGTELSLEDKELQKAIEAALKGQGAALEDIIKKKKAVNAEDEKNKVTIEDIKEKLATGLQSAIEGLIDGTKTLGESLAGIAKSIGSMFLQAGIRSMLGLAEGGYATGGIKAFASGGLVTRPTLGLVGEAGEDEYIIPSSKMQGAMERYSAGARGQAVIPGGGTVASGSGVPGGSVQIDYTGPILNFNSEEFVPKSAIPAIVNSAARKGASAGSAQVFNQMRNSRSTRSRMAL